MFSIKFLIAYIIPDTPADVKMALSKVDGVNLTAPYIRRIPRGLTYPVFLKSLTGKVSRVKNSCSSRCAEGAWE